jgi:hypothetical protein
MSAAAPQIRVQGRRISVEATAFGRLEPVSDHADTAEVRTRLGTDGCVLLRAFFPAAKIAAAARAVRDHLAAPDETGVRRNKRVLTALADAPAVRALRHDTQVLDWFSAVFGEPARSFDHTWVRAVPPGDGTAPHCDLPYMARGTDRLLTMWLPLTPVTLADGPLAILAGSHQHPTIQDYCRIDADRLPRRLLPRFRHGRRVPEAKFSRNADGCRRELGGRWLTSTFEPGDAVVFSARTLHCSLDNTGHSSRLSLDTRYQPSAALCDPRWSGSAASR